MITRVFFSLAFVVSVSLAFPHLPTSKIPDCQDVPEGTYFPDPTSCAKYWTCTNDGPVLSECTGGLFFNFDLEVCDYPENVDCDQGITSSTSTSGDLTTDWITTTPSISTTNLYTTDTTAWTSLGPDVTTGGSDLTTQVGEAPDCRDQPEGTHFPDPFDCARFWTCTNDGPILNVCPDGLFFNIDLEACDFEENVDCGHISSTEGPEK
ncbi:peritrophin-1-like [Tigriopus californicus]|uniref:peritrophin-1-like n=1 Tax=Tigriopus californicus TaxID=6832 RepID=UPI0027D9F19C|nr:peritrophin-1-like [Tigriopus californicus]